MVRGWSSQQQPRLLDELIKQYERSEEAGWLSNSPNVSTNGHYNPLSGYAKGEAPKLKEAQQHQNYRNGSS
jgi:hypothetical protein